MRRTTCRTLLASLVGALAAFAACSSSSTPSADTGAPDRAAADAASPYPNLPKGNPIVPEVAAFPFPSDFFLAKDPSTPTGRRIELPAEVLPRNIGPAVFQKIDGFSRIPIILTLFAAGVDDRSLPDPNDPATTTAPGSPVFLVEEGTWTKIPILVEKDLSAKVEGERSLIIRPLRLLAAQKGFVVIIRSKLLDLSGKPLQAQAAFRALRDGIKTDVPEIERQREDFKLVRTAIEKLGLDPAEVVQAWSFHTRSEDAVQRPLLAMQAAMNKAPLGGYTVVSDAIEDKDGKKNRQIVAKLKVPSFVGSDKRIHLDASGAALQQGEREIAVGVTIPSTVDAPRPVILFGHGFLGSWAQGTRGSFNDLCTASRFSAVMSHFGFNDTLEVMLGGAMAQMGEFETIVAEVLQTLANYTALARLVKEKLAQELTTQGPSGPVKVFDPAQVHYMGISNGGTFGFVVAATSPQLTRANLVVGGGGLIHFLQRSVVWNEYRPLLDIIYPDARDQQLVLSLMQIVIDPMDSMNYVEHLVKNRFPGCQPLRAAMHMAINDSQVHNLVSEWVARTADIPLVTPSPKTIFGLRTVTAPQPDGAQGDVSAALFVYDEKVEGYPTGNIPPAKDNGTHGTVCKLDEYKKTTTALIEHGKLTQFCDGACDPH